MVGTTFLIVVGLMVLLLILSTKTQKNLRSNKSFYIKVIYNPSSELYGASAFANNRWCKMFGVGSCTLIDGTEEWNELRSSAYDRCVGRLKRQLEYRGSAEIILLQREDI